MDFKEEFINACRELGTSEICLGHKKLMDYPLKEKHWLMVLYALQGFQYQIKLIAADAVAEDRIIKEVADG
jgi:hypothetical protein